MPEHKVYSHSFTANGDGTTADLRGRPLNNFGVQVTGTGAAATAWTVSLQGSIDGVNFTEILAHGTADTNGKVKWTGANLFPVMYVKPVLSGLTLAPATALVVHFVGMSN